MCTPPRTARIPRFRASVRPVASPSETGLVRSERKGVELHNVSRCREIDERYPGLLSAIVAAHQRQLERTQSAARKRSRSA